MFRQRLMHTARGRDVAFVGISQAYKPSGGTYQYPSGAQPGDICIMLFSSFGGTATPPFPAGATMHYRDEYSDDYWHVVSAWIMPAGKSGGDDVDMSNYANDCWVTVLVFRPTFSDPVIGTGGAGIYTGSGNPGAMTPQLEAADDGDSWLIGYYMVVSNYGGISTSVTGKALDYEWNYSGGDGCQHFMSFCPPGDVQNTTYDTADTTGGRHVYACLFTIT